MARKNIEDYRELFIRDIPLMDMRAPVEFAQGAFPASVNHPLMTDSERQAVGTCYKQQGQEAAIALGHKLVCGETKAARVAQWKAFCEANPQGYLYCFRGGLRSRISQQWLKEAGVDYPMVIGGYKALRRFLIDTLEDIVIQPKTLIGGNTGCGKTQMLTELANGIDLEGAANHRGSSFGRYVSGQRTQIAFENTLAVDMLKKQAAGHSHLVYEDEGRIIGSVSLPLPLLKTMQQAPIALVDDPVDVRLERLLAEYVVRMQQDFCLAYGDDAGWQQFAAYLAQGLFAIRKRLGYQRYENLLAVQQRAIHRMQVDGTLDGHYDWLHPLLSEYYDPMYSYQLSKKADRVVFRGRYAEVRDWLRDTTVK